MVEIKDLCMEFNGRSVLADVSLTIGEGEIFGLLGPNGAGKSTTLRLISSLLAPTSGQIQVLGYTVGKDDDHIRHRIGVVTESPGIYDKLSAWDNLDFFAACYGMDKSQRSRRIENLLRFFELWDRRGDLAGRFSKGMKQKLAIARALLADPQLLLLDEPTANLDPVSIRNLKDLVQQLAKEGKTIIYCSHTLAEIDELCDRFAILNKRLLRVGTPQQLRQEWAEYNVSLQVAAKPDETERILLSSAEIERFERSGNLFQLRISDTRLQNPVLLQKLLQAGVPVEYLERAAYTLEEAYLALLESEKEAG